MKRNITSTLAALSLAAAMMSCAHSANDATLKSALNQTAQMTSGTLNTVTDADGAGIAWTLNDGEVQLARLAVQNASSQAVKDFAQMMITDHTNANTQLQSHGYGKADNPATMALTSMVNKNMAMLQAKSGADFDRAYINSQVDMHMSALDTVRGTLLPSATNPDLRNVLSTMNTAVQMHLQRAREIQGSTGGTMPMQH